jgi:hypothetical protein
VTFVSRATTVMMKKSENSNMIRLVRCQALLQGASLTSAGKL